MTVTKQLMYEFLETTDRLHAYNRERRTLNWVRTLGETLRGDRGIQGEASAGVADHEAHDHPGGTAMSAPATSEDRTATAVPDLTPAAAPRVDRGARRNVEADRTRQPHPRPPACG